MREFKTTFRITGDSRGADAAIRNTRGEIDKLGRALDGQTKLGRFASDGMFAVAARATGMAVAFTGVVASIGRFAQSIADPIDRIRDLSIQTGASVEFLSGMEHAANLTGGSLEALAKGMLKSQRSITDLGDGVQTQVTAFGRLGLTYEQLRKLSPEDQFLEIANRLGSMADVTQRTATAQTIFGRGVSNLIPLFASGKEGIAKMRAEAERLGLVVSKEFADQADAFNDSLTSMKGVSTGIMRQIGEGLLPNLTALMQSFVDNAEASDEWKKSGEFLGNVVRALVAMFITLKEIVVITGKAIWAAGKVIIDTLAAIIKPVQEFGDTLSRAFNELIQGNFKQAADAFSGLGDRMAKAFTGNIDAIKNTLNEFGQDASGRIAKAIEAVNDVLLRQAVVTEDAAAGLDKLGNQTEEEKKAAEAAAKAFQALTDRLDPLAKLQREFTIEQAILIGKIAEGGDMVAYYEMLLEKLKEEYAEAAREAVGFGDDAERAAERAAKAAEREAERKAKALAKQQAAMETFQKAFERGVERMDDLGADLWKGWFSGAKDALKSIKDFFINWLAEMAHAAITRPILVRFATAMGIGMPGASMAGGMGMPGATGGIGGGGIGAGNFGSLLSMFTGSSIGLGFQNLPTWLGGTNAGMMTTAGGLFGNAAAYSNLAYGGTAIIAGLLGQKIFGGHGGIGSSIGATIGLAAGGPIGAILGGLAGGALGGLFGKSSTPDLYASGTSAGARKNQFAVDTALGGLFLGHDDFDDDLLPDITSGIQQFDQAIASFLDKDQIGTIAEALKNWNIELHGDAITMEALLGSRFTAILSTFSEDVRQYVNEVSGLEERVKRLGLATIAEKIIASAPELFEGKTFRDFIAVAEKMQGAGEELTDTFQRLVATVVQIADQLTLVRGFASSDLETDYNALVAGQNVSPRDAAAAFTDKIRELGSVFTGSVEDLDELSRLVTGRYDAEIAYLMQIDGIIAGLSASFKPLREQIERDMIGEAEFGRRAGEQARALAEELKAMTDPAQIAATVQEIQRLAGIAYGALDEETRKAAGQSWLDFLTSVENTALANLTGERTSCLDDSEGVRALVEEMSKGFGDPLDMAAQYHMDAAEEMQDAADMHQTAAGALEDSATAISDAATKMIDVGSSLNAGIGLWTSDIRGAITSLTMPPPATNVTQAIKTIAQVAAAEIRRAGDEAAVAIRQSPSKVQVVVAQSGPRMVTS